MSLGTRFRSREIITCFFAAEKRILHYHFALPPSLRSLSVVPIFVRHRRVASLGQPSRLHRHRHRLLPGGEPGAIEKEKNKVTVWGATDMNDR